MNILKPALLLCLAAAACAPAPGATAEGAAAPRSESAPRAQPARRDPHRVTFAEIRAQPSSDALTLVQRVRPQWLRDPVAGDPGSMASDVVVYLDGNKLGGRSELRQIPAATIGRMEFMEGRLASRRWGVTHALGAILVYTRTPGDDEQS